MKKIYFSKKEFITLTYDHLVYVVLSDSKYKIIECENINIGDKLYYFDDKLNQLIFKRVIKINNDIICHKRAYFGSLPFSGTTNQDGLSAKKLHGLKYDFLLRSEDIWNIYLIKK